MPPKVTCRPAGPQDRSAIADLVLELQAYHHLPAQELGEITHQVEAAEQLFHVLVAVDEDGGVVGIALANVYPGPGIAPGLYLKELFVRESARSLGVGKVLMQALAKLAIQRGYQRIDWITTKDNGGAQRFYERLGATLNPEKVFYRLDGVALNDLAKA